MRAPEVSQDPAELSSSEVIEEPHRLYARLCAEHPVSRVSDTGVHVVARWDLIEGALTRDVEVSANITGALMRSENGIPPSSTSATPRTVGSSPTLTIRPCLRGASS